MPSTLRSHGEGEGARAAEIRKRTGLLTEHRMEDRKCLRHGTAPSLSVNRKGGKWRRHGSAGAAWLLMGEKMPHS